MKDSLSTEHLKISPQCTRVYDELRNRAKKMDAGREKRLEAVKTRPDAEAYIERVRGKVKRLFAPLEELRIHHLRAEVTGVLSVPGGVCIEKIILRGDLLFPVTGLLFLPENHKGALPGVLCFCGHSNNGKSMETYQRFPQMLARMGYAAFSFDPHGQGERRAAARLAHGKAPDIEEFVRFAASTEHNFLGKPLHLTGDGIVNLWMRDALAAMDYLVSRPEVDPGRIGVTGCSGGGNMSVFYPAFDRRVKIAAPSCWTNRYFNNLENELISDIEQFLPGIMKAGLDVGDLFLASSPNPVLILGHKDDFFDHRAVRKDYEEIRKFYTLLGCPERVKLHIGEERHGYSLDHREQMYRFFNLYFGIRHDGREAGDLKIFPEKEILCTPTGDALDLPEAVPFHQQIRIPKPVIRNLPELIRKTMRLKKVEREPRFRAIRPQDFGMERVYYSRFAIETAPGMDCILKRIASNALHHIEPSEDCVLYLPHEGTLWELPEMKFPDGSGEIYGLDVRGFGENMPSCANTNPHAHDVYAANEYYWMTAFELAMGNDWLALQLQDVIASIAVLKGTGGVRRIHLAGRGAGAILAALAACVMPEVKRVTLYNAPLSWAQIVRDPVTRWDYMSLPFGILRKFDLPEVYRFLRGKNLSMIEPWNNLCKPCSESELKEFSKQYEVSL